MGSGQLQICLLGELRLIYRGGRTAALPASRKTRALLGYLVATGRPHLRERLCELFWDEGADDPRAELRWSLTKLRPLFNETNAVRLVSDRNRVAFEARGAELDVSALRQLLGSEIAAASLDALKAAAQYSGEFLDGLDLPACYRYQAWCLAEREALSALRLSALSELLARARDQPAEALTYARALVGADPLSIAGHCAVIRTLDGLGRHREALEHYEQAVRVVEKELGVPADEELHEAARVLRSTPSPRAGARSLAQPVTVPPVEVIPGSTRAVIPFVGRSGERRLLDRLVDDAARRQCSLVLHVTGEPGIGKSHLLDQLRQRMELIGGRTFAARAFEAEMARPYGVWADLFAAVAHEPHTGVSLENLGGLAPELTTASQGPADKGRLLARALEVLEQLAANQPILIALDDIQWMDESSAALFHYVARTCDHNGGLLLACATRAGELEDNPAVANALASLRRERKLREIRLEPLTCADTAELIRTVNSTLDSARTFEVSDGNPLFILELARAHGSDADDPQRTLEAVIGRELARLTDDGRELLIWAAALGRSFDVAILAELAAVQSPRLLAALRELERRGVLYPTGDSNYDFVHDIVRQVAYHGTSQPRRKLLHARISRHLAPLAEADDNHASAVARHAALSSEHLTAARACILAGERCLRLFANAEARSFAERGLWHLGQCSPGRDVAENRIAVHKIQVLAAAVPTMRPLPSVAAELTRAIAAAEALGLHQAVMTGHYLLSIVHQEAGQNELARQSTLSAMRAGRAADDTTYIHQLANTARCLLELETEIPRARALLHEAEILAQPLGREYCEIAWGRGLMQRWDGEAELAALSIGHALDLARSAADRWREYKCLTWLAMLELEQGRSAAARAHCAEMLQVARKLGDAEVPLAMTLDALAQLASGGEHEDRQLVAALEQLRAIDDKSHLAYALNVAAILCLGTARADAARAYAREALQVAETMQRTNDRVIAHATLIRLRQADRTASTEAEHSDEGLRQASMDADVLSSRARSALLGTLPAGGHPPAPLQR
jgi:predicted ATPase/DNA-binding SARP family transcriptional activator